MRPEILKEMTVRTAVSWRMNTCSFVSRYPRSVGTSHVLLPRRRKRLNITKRLCRNISLHIQASLRMKFYTTFTIKCLAKSIDVPKQRSFACVFTSACHRVSIITFVFTEQLRNSISKHFFPKFCSDFY